MEVIQGKVLAGRGTVARRVRVAAASLALITALGGSYAAGRLTAPAIQGRERPGMAVQRESDRANGPSVIGPPGNSTAEKGASSPRGSDAATHPRHFRPKWGWDQDRTG